MRLAFNIALILSVLYLPWWATAVILVSACFVVGRFYEAIMYGIALDALYGTSFGFHGFAYVSTVFSLAVFIIASLVRERLAW